jgi:hypothetical protein
MEAARCQDQWLTMKGAAGDCSAAPRWSRVSARWDNATLGLIYSNIGIHALGLRNHPGRIYGIRSSLTKTAFRFGPLRVGHCFLCVGLNNISSNKPIFLRWPHI